MSDGIIMPEALGPFDDPKFSSDVQAGVFSGQRLVIHDVDQLPPGMHDGGQGPWSLATAYYLESLPGPHPCPPTRFRVLRSAQGLHLRIESHWLPLETVEEVAGEAALTRDAVYVVLQPAPHQASSQAIECRISPQGDLQISSVRYAADSTVASTQPLNDVHDETRPWQSVSLQRSLERVYAWHAEVVLPWGVFHDVGTVPPPPGSTWRGNVVRVFPGSAGDCHAAWRAFPSSNHRHADALGEWHFQIPPPRPMPVSSTAKTERLPRYGR